MVLRADPWCLTGASQCVLAFQADSALQPPFTVSQRGTKDSSPDAFSSVLFEPTILCGERVDCLPSKKVQKY